MATPTKSTPILIVGAGVFGLSTALELTRRGYVDITVLDRHVPPVPDGSSVDVSRIIRPDYADSFYARMGLDAMAGWTGEYAPFFYRSGLLCVQSQGTTQHSYLEQSQRNLKQLGASVSIQSFKGSEVTQQYPAIHGDLSHTSGYWNTECGWADAEKSIAHLARQCTHAGVSFVAGPKVTVTELVTRSSTTAEKEKVIGVRTAAGPVHYADTVILATGAWSPHLIDMSGRSVSTGQPVAFIQLSPQEAQDMHGCPVMIDLSTGWFAFPPTPGSNLLKMARHGYGYETTSSRSSSSSDPYSAPTISPQAPFLPIDAERSLREGLALFLPRFQSRPFVQRRLCWYTDTPRGDFIVDYHPKYEQLFLATGGSGHFERTASLEQQQKWAWTHTGGEISKGDGSRGGPPRRVLKPEEQARL